MKNLKCKSGLHDWKYHNEITRQCLDCGITQYKNKHFWKNITKSYLQPNAKAKEIKLDKKTETITIKKGVIFLETYGWQMLNDGTRAPSYLAHKIKEDIIIFPRYEYEQKKNNKRGAK